MHSPLLRLNTTIAVKFRWVIGVEAPTMFRRWRHGGRLFSFSITLLCSGGGGGVVSADDGAHSAVVVADMQRGERRRRGWQLGGGTDGAGWQSLRGMTAAARGWWLAKDTFPVTDVALGHRVQLVPGNPTGARPTHSNPRWSPPAMTPLLRPPWLALPTIPRTFRSPSVNANWRPFSSRLYDHRFAARSANAGKMTATKGPRSYRRVAGTEPGTPASPASCTRHY